MAIDTSSDWAGLALTNGQHWAELNWSSGRHQTTQVLPEIERLMDRMGVSDDDLGAIGVALGPGSFSGLRVGMSLAKGFSLADGLPLIGVATLESTIHAWGTPEQSVIGVIRAGRRRYVWAERSSLHDVRSGEVGDLVGSAPAGALVLGEVDEYAARALIEAGCSVPVEPLRRRRAGALAAIAWQRWVADKIDDAASLEPIYLHPT